MSKPTSKTAHAAHAKEKGKSRRENIYTLTKEDFCRVQNDVLKLSNSQMAEAIDVSERAVEEYRSGRRTVHGPLALLLMMSESAGVIPMELLGVIKGAAKSKSA